MLELSRKSPVTISYTTAQLWATIKARGVHCNLDFFTATRQLICPDQLQMVCHGIIKKKIEKLTGIEWDLWSVRTLSWVTGCCTRSSRSSEWIERLAVQFNHPVNEINNWLKWVTFNCLLQLIRLRLVEYYLFIYWLLSIVKEESSENERNRQTLLFLLPKSRSITESATSYTRGKKKMENNAPEK